MAKNTCVVIMILVVITFTSCKKFVSIDPPKTQLIDNTVFTDDITASAAVTGIYSRMISSSGFASGSFVGFGFVTGLSSDELKNYAASTPQIQFYTNSLLPSNSTVGTALWQEGYQYIYSSNAVIEGLDNSTGVTPSIKAQLAGEAKFIRAFCYFNLVNLFGDVPLILTTDYRVNTVAARAAKSQVYDQIIADLKYAQNSLSDNYVTPLGVTTTERVRPNKSAATALLARANLYTEKWSNAESEATTVINNTTKYTLVNNLNNVFLKNSTEAIWQLMPVVPGGNTNEGSRFILTSAPSLATLSDQILNAFEINDGRKTNWVNSYTAGTSTYYYPFKYKIKTGTTLSEYSMVLRLAEQYLIRAEARIQQNNISGAQSDLNIIRNRAGLPNTTAIDKASLLLAIEHERQVELFTECGHRWFDLIRTKRADAILGPLKAPNWQSTDVLYPIPQSEIIVNPNLVQNPGY